MKKTTPLRLCALLAYAVALLACTEDDDATTYTTYTTYISGTLSTNAHDYRLKGTTILLTAAGVTSPDPNSVSFRWTIADPDAHTAWGQTIRYRCPLDAASITVALAASAYDAYGLSASKTITLIDDTFARAITDIPPGLPFTDPRDGQTYQYQHIGDLDWMTQNLNWAANGAAGKEYKNQPEYSILFGRYYTWNELTDPANPICPPGWRPPANADWENLAAALNNGQPLPFDAHWRTIGSNAAADAKINAQRIWPYDPNNTKKNTHGWNALPAGKIAAPNTSSDNGRYGYWWSADPCNSETAYYRYIVYNNDLCYYNHGDRQGLHLSVRCVR
ncbi:MAG: hypothetical protein LBF90_05305 [Prevotellaceae bacterium]|jgi:uncharacterized protein (TIGR02145 family)|nr:hypothetical protein [Prevotellaceae bacterium]